MLQLSPVEQLHLINPKLNQDKVLKIIYPTANTKTWLSIVQVPNQIITTETHINHLFGKATAVLVELNQSTTTTTTRDYSQDVNQLRITCRVRKK